MSGFRPMLVTADVLPTCHRFDRSAPSGRLGRWVARRYVPPLDDRGASSALWLLASAFPQE